MKILRSKNLMGILYGVILSIPILSIGVRSAYTIVNKNAYQSYTGYNLETNTELATSIESGLNYQINTSQYVGSLYSSNSIEVEDLELTVSRASYQTWFETNKNNIKYINFYLGNDQITTFIGYYDANFTRLDFFGFNETNIEIKFKALGNTNITNNTIIYRVYQQQVGNSLDNVFDYSVSKLVDENNFGELNFFTWFSDWILTDAQQNMLYIRFANWYMNYALLVSLMQIIFLCLMWFVNFSRRLLERGMNYDW